MRGLLLAGLLLALSASASSAEVGGKRPYVVDGATIELLGVRVRLFGVTAPGPSETCFAGDQAWNCGQQARWALADRIGLNWVICQERGRDAAGAMIGLCYLGGVGGPELNGWIVARGWALARSRESDAYGADEAAARQAGLGLWRGGFVPPQAWRDR